MALLRIETLRTEEIRAAALQAMKSTDRDALGEYLASVDWTRHRTASPEVRELLGRLELLHTEYVEGDLSRADYEAALETLSHASMS